MTYFLPVSPGARHRRCPRHLPGPAAPRALLPARSSRALPCASHSVRGGRRRVPVAVGRGSSAPVQCRGAGPSPPCYTTSRRHSRVSQVPPRLPAARAPRAPTPAPCIAAAEPRPPRARAMSPPGSGTPRAAVTRVAGGAPRRG